MAPQPSPNARAHTTLTSVVGTVIALLGSVLVAVHLVLGGTSSLALASANPLTSWPYYFGFALSILGLLLHASQSVTSRQHIVIAVTAGIVGALTLPVAWLYFGFGGIGLESDEEVTALMAAFIAAVTPVMMVFVGGVFSWRTLSSLHRFRVRGMAVLAIASVGLSAVCIIFARLSFPPPGAN